MFPNCPGPIQSQHNMSCGSNATSRPWFRVCLRSSSVTYVSHIHAYIHTYIHTCMHACMHASIHPSVHPHIHIHACMHTCIHTYIHTYIHTCTHTRTNTIYQYKHTHTHTRTCVYIYIYTHICSHPPAQTTDHCGEGEGWCPSPCMICQRMGDNHLSQTQFQSFQISNIPLSLSFQSFQNV